MNAGKIPNTILEKIILEPLKQYGIKRSEVLSAPSVGEDCAAITMDGGTLLLSTDPITGAVNNIGKLAVNINANDIVSAGGEPIGIMITALLPVGTEISEIEKIMKEVCVSANELGMAVLGGHTEITEAVNKPILSCTVVGKCQKIISTGGANVGDKVIITKSAGLEGTGILAKDNREYLLGYLPEEVIDRAASRLEKISVLKEGRVGAEYGATAMHDITEGGVLGACYEAAECSGKGINVYLDKIPLSEETKRIAEIFKIDPYRLISSGCMLITHPEPEKMIEELEREGIPATVIGEITNGEKFIIDQNGDTHVLEEPQSDSLYLIKKDDAGT